LKTPAARSIPKTEASCPFLYFPLGIKKKKIPLVTLVSRHIYVRLFFIQHPASSVASVSLFSDAQQQIDRAYNNSAIVFILDSFLLVWAEL
jgi:hypothetical protein